MTNGSLSKAALAKQGADAAGLRKKRAEIIIDTVFGRIVDGECSSTLLLCYGFVVGCLGNDD